ncbi:MAG: methyltransferase domain-containing protein [Planctomycetes bacterium]|nr:methyltransferase domain-containing protein [Planctomycetota bacterium]
MRNLTTPLSKFVAPLCLLMIAIGFPSVAVAQDAKDQEIARLRQRITELEAQVEGLRKTPAISTATLEAEENVKPGINDSWRSEDIGPLIGRLETESREIFTERFKLAAVIGPPPGTVIADIGAGSGFMTNIFSRQVGTGGKVYAVDINATMLAHVAEGAKDAGLVNVETVLCTDKSTMLPDESIDMAFICDTYHHFEYPMNTMTSIWNALRPGGQVILVDFYRIEGVTSDFFMEHVRAGEEVFTQEIINAGFELVNDHDVEFLNENYLLRFRKVSPPGRPAASSR